MDSLFQLLFDSRWLYIAEVDADAQLRRANPAALELLGLVPEELPLSLGNTSLAPLARSRALELERGGSRSPYELTESIEIATPSGLVRWFDFRVTAYRKEGEERERFLWVGTDTTRRRRAEERVRLLFDESRDMLFSCTPDDRITEVNEAGVALLGARNAASLRGRKITDFYVSVADRDYYRHRMASQGYVKDLEVVMRKEDGTRLVVLETSTAIKNSEGTIAKYQGIIKDISERIHLEQEQMKMNIELAEANRKLRHTQSRMVQQEKLASVGRLAAGVAHEINNPLGFVKSNFQTLRQYFSHISAHLAETASAQPSGNGTLEHILSDLETLFEESETGFQRMVSIVQGLRNFARSGTDRREPYNLNTAVETTLAILRNEYKRVATVETKLEGIPDVHCVPDEINQVLLNLLVNAVQALRGATEGGDGGQARISVVTGRDDESVFCRIEDNGPGIDPGQISQIFEPFFTTKAHGEGTGLGLSISYDIIVNKHGGDLRGANREEGGAVFTLRLPLDRS